MPMRHLLPTLVALTALGGFGLVIGCEEYEHPPSAELDFPPEGTFIEGDLLAITFNEPIETDSLSVAIWRDTRNLEGELPADDVALVAGCTVASSPCDDQGTTVLVEDDGLTATVQLDPAGIGKPDVPLLVEIEPGLRSRATGATLNRSRLYDFQFKPAEVAEDPVPFEEGIYLFLAEFDEPIPNVLTLIADTQVTSDGRFMIVGAEADEIDGAAQNTQDPEELYIDTGVQAFVVFAEGTIRQNEAGERFVETTKFDIELNLASIVVALKGLRITGIVIKHPDTGRDRIQGTLSYEAIELSNGSNEPFRYPSGTTTFNADWIPPEVIPEGNPEICGEPCGIVPIQCNPPADFPPAGYCDDEEGSGEGDGSGLGEGSGDGA